MTFDGLFQPKEFYDSMNLWIDASEMTIPNLLFPTLHIYFYFLKTVISAFYKGWMTLDFPPKEYYCYIYLSLLRKR